MRREYRAIALDMDGTVLNDRKQIGERTKEAVHRALAADREVVFCTGRSLAEMREVLEEFPDMRYLCCASGSMLYDRKRGKPLKLWPIPRREREALRETVRGRDVMPHFISEGRCILNRDQIDRIGHYQMGVYQPLFQKASDLVDDVFEVSEREGWSAEKINLFHTSPDERSISRAKLERLKLRLTMIDAEISSLECTLQGVD